MSDAGRSSTTTVAMHPLLRHAVLFVVAAAVLVFLAIFTTVIVWIA